MTSHARLLPLLVVAPLALVGCGEGEPTDDARTSPTQAPATATQPAQETATQAPQATETQPTADTPTEAEGTPAATAQPTLPPGATYDSGYRTTSWVMSGDEGVDLDEDEVIDNNFVQVYELSVTVIANSVYVAAKQFLLDNNVDESDAEDIANGVRNAFLEFMTIDNFNVLLANAISENRLNFAEVLYGEPEGLSLSWYSAVPIPDSDSFALRTSIGVQPGTTTLSAASITVGPGDLTYDFSSIYDGPFASNVLMLTGEAVLVVSQSYSTFEYGSTELTAGDIGGLVSQEAMLNFMRGLVPAGFCNPQTETCEQFDILNDTIASLEAVYTDAANASLWSFQLDGAPAVPVGFGWTASEAPLVDEVGNGKAASK